MKRVVRRRLSTKMRGIKKRKRTEEIINKEDEESSKGRRRGSMLKMNRVSSFSSPFSRVEKVKEKRRKKRRPAYLSRKPTVVLKTAHKIFLLDARLSYTVLSSVLSLLDVDNHRSPQVPTTFSYE